MREATVAVQAEADGQIPGPLNRTPFDEAGEDQGDFTKYGLVNPGPAVAYVGSGSV